jgi:hypothetical protein
MSAPGDPIEEYLDLLYTRLRGSPREGRRILAEAEEHLRDAVTESVAAGLTQREAAEHAISAFGPVSVVARAHESRQRRLPAANLLADLVMSGWLLASVGLIAIGASGLVAAVMNSVFGPRFVGGNPSATGLSAVACRHYLAMWPAARTCAQAAMLEGSVDAVTLRLAGGLAGLLALAAYLAARRWHARTVLPDAFVPTVAVSLFSAAAAVLGWQTVNHQLSNLTNLGRFAHGSGATLSGAIVALAMAVAYLWPLRRSLLRSS